MSANSDQGGFGKTLLSAHFLAGYFGYRDREPYDPDYGTNNCTHYPAGAVQRAYEDGRLSACQELARQDIAKRRWHRGVAA